MRYTLKYNPIKLFHAYPLKLSNLLKRIFNLKQDLVIVSCAPFIAIKQNNANYPKHSANNVSRETLLARATEGETI